MRTTAAAPPVILSEAKDLHGLWGPQRATAAVTPVILSEAKDLHLKENKQAAKAKALSCHPERSEGSPGPMRLSPHLVCPLLERRRGQRTGKIVALGQVTA